MKVFAFLSVATATVIYATTSHRRYYASDNHRDYPNFFDDPRTSSGSRSANSHSSSGSSPDSPSPGSPSDSSQPTNIRSVRSVSFPEHSEDFSNPHIRTIRNVEESADYLKHTTILAHLVNGIALQHGLMNGTISPSDAVGELLNFGSVAVSSIVNFKKDGINTLIEKLKSVKSDIDPNFKDYEKIALQWNEVILEVSKIGDVKNLTGIDSYLQVLEGFIKNFKFGSFEKPGNAFATGMTDLEYIKTLKPTNSDNFDKLSTLKTHLKKAISYVTDFKSCSEELQKNYKSLENGPAVFSPVEKTILLSKKRNFNKIIEKQYAGPVKKNIEAAVQVSKYAQDAQKDVLILNNLAESISAPGSIQRKYTNGFPNGLADLKPLLNDVRDRWIQEVINITGANPIVLTDGLEPLFRLQKRLEEMDDKLSPISTATNMNKALSDFKKLQKGLSDLKSESVDLVEDLFEKLNSARFVPLYENSYEEIMKSIQTAKDLQELSDAAIEAMDGFDAEKLNKEIDKLFDSLGFKNFNDENGSKDEFGTVFEDITTNGKLKGIRDFIDGLNKRFRKISATTEGGLKKRVQQIFANKDKINKFTGLDEEINKVHGYLKPLQNNSEKVSQAIKAYQQLRDIRLEDIPVFETVASAISDVAQDLSLVSTIPDEMKKDVSQATTEINKLPDSLAKSVVIGHSVNSLRSAFALRDLKAEVEKLKTIDSAVQAVIQKIWGNYKEDMAELEKTLGDIERFEKNLNVSNLTTIGAYGTPLTALASLTSVNMNAKEKSKALEALLNDGALKMDPTVKENIEKSKDTLDQLADLDLGFASHTTQFQSAPGVFSDLQNFLTKLLQVPMSPRQPSGQVPGAQGGPGGADAIQQGQKSDEEEKGLSWYYIALIVLFSLGGGGGAGVGFYLWHKRSQWKKWLAKLLYWIRSNALRNVESAITVHSNHVERIRLEARSWTPTENTVAVTRRRRADLQCNSDSAVLLPLVDKEKNVMIYANKIKTKKGLKLIATQAPSINTEFWMMVMQENSDFVISMCSDDEMTSLECSYYPHKVNETVSYGPYSVCLKEEKLTASKKVKQRTLVVTDSSSKDKKTKTLTHLQSFNWPVDTILDDHTESLEILDLVKDSTTPIIVHCADGGSKTMSLIGLQYVYEEVKDDPSKDFDDLVVEMCNKTWHSIKENVFTAWIASGVRIRLITEFEFHNEEASYTTDKEVLKKMKVALEEKRVADTKADEARRLQAEQDEKDRADRENQQAEADRIKDAEIKNLKDENEKKEAEKAQLVQQAEIDKAAALQRAEEERKEKERAELKKKIQQWIKKQRCTDINKLFALHSGILKAMDVGHRDKKKALDELPIPKHRFAFLCNPDTAVIVKSRGKRIPIHANHVKTDSNVRYIAAQAPMPKEENRDDTCEDFWVMVLYENAEFIVNLCDELQTRVACGNYYSSEVGYVECGRFKVITKSVELILEGAVKKRILEVTDNENEFKPAVIKHHQFLAWPDHGVPKGHDAALGLMNIVKESKVPIVVHCHAGVGRTCAFIGLQLVYEEILKHPENSMIEPMYKLRDQRWNAVQTSSQSFWIYLGIVLRLIREYKLDMNDYTEQNAIFNIKMC
ncbi:hypothetical protein CRE_02635 [Caenorhabditis remanei]|uniref:Tyrosine-protein phosphatase domain-containing protein n=1 Tax=Caenorhabditis remanei TaxID=31234 RepID=E3NDC3_CAERE|nr:hypothetical protein CRE_02635 [Caenorhabditis remanei]